MHDDFSASLPVPRPASESRARQDRRASASLPVPRPARQSRAWQDRRASAASMRLPAPRSGSGGTGRPVCTKASRHC